MRQLCLWLVAAVSAIAAALPFPPALAKTPGPTAKSAWQEAERAREQARAEMERQRELARQERERAREEARRAKERAKQLARSEAERQREQRAAEQAARRGNAAGADGTRHRETAARNSTAPAGKTGEPGKASNSAAKADDDNDDDRRAPSGKRGDALVAKPGSNNASNRSAVVDTGPPATVADWLRSLGFSTQSPTPSTDRSSSSARQITTGTVHTATPAAGPSLAPASSGTPPAPAPAAKTTTATVAAKGASAKASGDEKPATKSSERAEPKTDPKAPGKDTNKTVVRKPPPPPPTGDPIAQVKPGEARTNELLAVGMTEKSLAIAQQHGIAVTNTFTKPGVTPVTQLTLPPGMPPHVARDLLRAELPHGAFALNRLYYHDVYRGMRLARSPHDSSTPQATPTSPSTTSTAAGIPAQPLESSTFGPAHTTGCSVARCFAPRLIGWQETLASCTIGKRIGIIDTNVERTHPALANARIIERAFTPHGTAPVVDGHGTSVLALLAGDPKSSTPGLAPKAEYLVANVFGTDPSGKPVSDTFSLLKAIDWLHRNNVQVVNVSLAGGHDPLLEKAIRDYTAKGMLFIAAAGNEGPAAKPSYPAAYPEVIAVTAVDKEMRGYRHANRGAYIDVAAPGVGVWTALPQSKQGPATGTSFAAPHVTALIASVHHGATDRSKEGLLSLLATRDLGPAGPDPIYGRGLLLAPSSCRPGGGSAVAATAGWRATVVPAGLTRTH